MPIDYTLLRCLNCKHGELQATATHLICPACLSEVPLRNGVPLFEKLETSDINDGLDAIKHSIKKYSEFYNLLVKVISPVYYDYKFEKKFINDNVLAKDFISINLGSGNSRLCESIINVDIFAYPKVDLVCNLENIPLNDNIADVIFNIAVIEHLKAPALAVREMHRILKPGGLIYSFVPFMQGFHASPHDYQRYTREGLKKLYEAFHIVEVKNGEGPISGFLWVFQEAVAILLSFNNKVLHRYILILMMALTFPIKYLDALLLHHPCAHHIAGGFILIGKKL